MGKAISGFARSFDASGSMRMVNYPGGGAARIERAEVRAATGARVRVSGGDGVTYYWPAGRLRIDGLIQTAGGGLPTGQILLRQPRGGGAMSGFARFAPYQAGASRLALDPIRFQASAGGATNFSTAAVLDGPFTNGRVQGLRLPLNGTLGPGGALLVGRGCLVTSWRFFQFNDLRLNAGRLPVCPIGPAIVTKTAGGLRIAASVNRPRLNGRLGSAPLSLTANSFRIADRNFNFAQLGVRLGKPKSPVALDAARLQGTFRGSGVSGTFGDAKATIGEIPLAIDNADGRWSFVNSKLQVNGALTLSDRTPDAERTPAKALCDAVVTRAFYNELLLLSCGVSTVRFMPPLSTTTAQVDEAMALLRTSLDEAQAQTRS